MDDADLQRIRQIDAQYEDDAAKLQKVRKLLSKKKRVGGRPRRSSVRPGSIRGDTRPTRTPARASCLHGIARRSQEIASVQRQIDEIPSRTELTQYQKRFLELYNLVASKLSETRQFYSLYNILDATKLYLTREVTLLNSIFDNFEKAKATKNNQDKFLDTLETMVKNVRDLLAKVRRRCVAPSSGMPRLGWCDDVR